MSWLGQAVQTERQEDTDAQTRLKVCLAVPGFGSRRYMIVCPDLIFRSITADTLDLMPSSRISTRSSRLAIRLPGVQSDLDNVLGFAVGLKALGLGGR